MRNFKSSVVAVALVFGLAACDEATGPSGSQGQMEVAATGDSDGNTSVSPTGAPSYSQSFSGAQGSAEGTVHFRARVYVQANAGQWVEVTENSADTVTVDASGRSQTKTFANARVNAGTYNRVRVVFEEVKANVTGGINLDLGLLTGEVRVNLDGNSQAVVERDVNLTVRSDATTRMVIDLNADAWLQRTNSQTRTVSKAEFESAVRVFAQQS